MIFDKIFNSESSDEKYQKMKKAYGKDKVIREMGQRILEQDIEIAILKKRLGPVATNLPALLRQQNC